MAPHPYEPRLVFEVKWDVFFPEVHVFFILKTFLLPIPYPSFGNGIHHIFTVRINGYRNPSTFNSSKPLITARSSIRLLVVIRKPSDNSLRWLLYISTVPYPPFPGFPLAAPSV